MKQLQYPRCGYHINGTNSNPCCTVLPSVSHTFRVSISSPIGNLDIKYPKSIGESRHQQVKQWDGESICFHVVLKLRDDYKKVTR